ncbi:MAG: DNA primase [Clostridiales bacterium]|nr:DNA primase [Clostridiales bacterium]
MGHIPDEVIQEILDKADIQSVVGKYVSFTKRTGQNMFGLCPFHSEKSPSFSISLTKNIYRCFGCNKGGNSIGFIMEMERMSFPEAVRFLGKEYGVEVPEDNSYDKNENNKKHRERVYKLLTEAARFFYLNFNGDQGKKARDYAASRQLSNATLKNFGIGYSLDSYDSLYKHLNLKGYTDDEMKDSGLFTISQKNGRLYDLFRGRLMFPIFDAYGTIIAFGGRAMGDEKPKYINSPESVVYKKQDHLYALNFARTVRSKQLIIVEGYMDAIAMHQAGIKNVVASLGTAFTDSQLKLVSKYAEEVVFFFDSDNAGQNAAIRAIEMMFKYLRRMSGLKIKIKIACVPDGKDPDGYIKEHGAEAFGRIVNAAKSVEDYLFDRAYNDCFKDNKLDLASYQDKVILYGSWINDEIKRYRFASEANLYLKATPEVLVKRMEELENSENENENKLSIRTIDKDNKEELERRKVSSEKKKGIPDDYATELELEVICYAVILKDALLDPNIIDPLDIVRPADFYGKNMQLIVEYMLTHFSPKGINEAALIGELGKYLINGEKAEIVYLKESEKLPLNLGVTRLSGEYLIRLCKLRKEMLMQKKLYIVKRLDNVPEENERTKLFEALRKIDKGLEYIKKKEENL